MSGTADDYNLKEHIRLLAKTKVLTARCAELTDQRRAMVRAAVLRDDENAALKAAARALLDATPICDCKGLKEGQCFASCIHYYIDPEIKALEELL